MMTADETAVEFVDVATVPCASDDPEKGCNQVIVLPMEPGAGGQVLTNDNGQLKWVYPTNSEDSK
jgi:hypothetical protein